MSDLRRLSSGSDDRRSFRPQIFLVCTLTCFGWLASTRPMLALGGAALLVLVGAVYRLAAISALLLGAYLVPLFAFGRVYAYLGFDPIYVPEVLLIAALALSVPLWWQTYLSAVPPWYRWASLGFSLAALAATYNGLAHGYSGALKGLVFVAYPLASGPCAAWIRVHDTQWRRVVLAAVCAAPVGLLILTVTDLTAVIPAAYGFYLSGLVALAASWRPGHGRRILVVAACVGPLLLVGMGRRGPLLTLIVTALVAQIAWRRKTSRTIRPLIIACTMGAAILILTIGVGGVAPSRLPVVGTAVRRTTQSVESQSGEAEANVAFRLDLWRYSMETAMHHGFWLGTGFGRPFDFRFRAVDYRTVDTGGPHNSFVGVFYFMGIPAGLAFIAMIVAAFRSAGRRDGSAQVAPFQLALLAAAVVTMFTNVALEAPYIGGPIWILIGWSVLARPAETAELTEVRHAALHA